MRKCGWVAVVAAATVLVGSSGAHAAGRCGTHPWCDTSLTPQTRASLLLGALTQDEKVALLGGDEVTGVAGGAHTHTGTQNGVPRLGIPTVLYSDGPVGPRQGLSTGLPIPLALAATFSPSLAAAHGGVAAAEARAKGNDVIFGPAVNIARNPLSGRTYENYGEDPYLQSRLVVPWIEAAQKAGVIADVKHYAANNQEGVDVSGGLVSTQTPLGAGVVGTRFVSNSVMSERTLREIYLPHFEAAVREAKVGTVMCSYNRINGDYGCENQHLLQQILRREWGFDGYVLADYGAAHNTFSSLFDGLDFEPWPPVAYQPALLDAVIAGRGSSAVQALDGHVRAMLETWFRFGLFDRAAYRDDDAQIDKPANAAVAREIEEQAITLLRNQGGVLPLTPSTTKRIAVIGRASTTFTTGGGSGNIKPFAYAAPLDAIRARAGDGTTVTSVPTNDTAAAVKAAGDADVALVFVNDYYTEGADRTCLTLQCPMVNGNQDALVRAVAAANRRTIVIVASGGPDLMPWRDDVSGIVQMWMGGGQAGPALARVLYGDVDPGGRLPITFPASEKQLPTAPSRDRYPGTATFDTRYLEGVLMGYRWYDAKRLEPAYPFGFGLSYTTMRFSGLTVRRRGRGAVVSATVKNTGARRGWVVPQLYVGLPEPSRDVVQPPSQLKAFTKFVLAPGATRRFTLTLDERALSYWDEGVGGWRVAPGCVAIRLGSSSRDLPLQGVLATGGASCPQPPGAVCRSRRTVRFTLPRGARGVRLTVDGSRRAVVRTGGRVVVKLNGLPKRAVKVRITARVNGRAYVRTSTLHPCS